MNFRFAVISDPHIALPQTIASQANRFHLVEVSVSALEAAIAHLAQLDLDFLLLPGDLTQDGEPPNHQWLTKRLLQLPFPVYVIPGNHDVPTLLPTDKSIGFEEFPQYYRRFGYENSPTLYYNREILPGVHLIGLNSNFFDAKGQQLGAGYLDEEQLIWLENLLPTVEDQLVLVMVHHNVLEHLPGQSQHELGRRYMLANAPRLLDLLKKHQVKLIFTGHLHVQDIAYQEGIYEITTGSLVSYPHPYRIIEVNRQSHQIALQIESHRIESLLGWENLPSISRQWLSERSFSFMMRLLTAPPLNLPTTEAEKFAPQLRHLWADIAGGDAVFDFPNLPTEVRLHFQKFGAVDSEGNPRLIDNQALLVLR